MILVPLPYKLYGVFLLMFKYGKTSCTNRKVDRGWQIYFNFDISLWRGSRARARLQGLFQAKICNWALRHFLSILLAQPTGPIVGATNKPSGSVKLGVGAEIRPVAPPGIADFRHRRDIVRNGAGGRGIMYGVYGRKKKRKMSVLLAFCHTFIYCIYPPQYTINCWRFGLFHINRLE